MKVFILCVVLAVASAVQFGEEQTAVCDRAQCVRTCLSGGWTGGYCMVNACVCLGFRAPSLEEDHLENIAARYTGVQAKTAAACEGKECVLYCQRMGKSGGFCVAGNCLCF